MNGAVAGDEADALVVNCEFDVWAAFEAGCCAAIVGVDAPGAAAKRVISRITACDVWGTVGRGLCVVFQVNVFTPLPGIAVHIVKPPGIGHFLADRMFAVARVVKEPHYVVQLAIEWFG